MLSLDHIYTVDNFKSILQDRIGSRLLALIFASYVCIIFVIYMFCLDDINITYDFCHSHDVHARYILYVILFLYHMYMQNMFVTLYITCTCTFHVTCIYTLFDMLYICRLQAIYVRYIVHVCYICCIHVIFMLCKHFIQFLSFVWCLYALYIFIFRLYMHAKCLHYVHVLSVHTVCTYSFLMLHIQLCNKKQQEADDMLSYRLYVFHF